jgi:hypothetical protein
MKLENKLKALSACAREEKYPRVDIAGSVLMAITAEHRRTERTSERILMWLAAASSAVAVPAAVVAVIARYFWTNPLIEISQAIFWVIQ